MTKVPSKWNFSYLSFLTTRLSNTPYPCYSAFEVHIDN